MLWTPPRDDWRLLALLVVLPMQWSACYGSGQRDVRALRSPAASDQVFRGPDLLWATSRASVVACATACMDDQSCVGFTVAKMHTGKVECRGHSSQSPQGGVSHPEARLYLLQSPPHPSPTVSTAQSPSPSSATTAAPFESTTEPPLPTTTALATTTQTEAAWLNSGCSSHADCGELYAECFQSRGCLCTPGYYYSLSTAKCVLNCASEDLQNQLIAYPGYRFGGNNLNGYPVEPVSVEECQQRCLSSTTHCRTAKYRLPRDRCGIAGVSRFDVETSDFSTDGDFIYYQRVCK